MTVKPAKSSLVPAGFDDDDDLPELTEEQLDRAEFAIGGKIIRPATGTLTRSFGRPRSAAPKTQVSVRLDQDLLKALRDSGPGWQGRVNALLREAFKI